MTDEPRWRRLNPRMLLVHPVTELTRLSPVLLGLFVAGTKNGVATVSGLVGAALAAGVGSLAWFTTTYRITPEQIQLRRGLLSKQLLVAPLDRVRSVDSTANYMQRLLGLRRVQIGTGNTGPATKDLVLDGLDTAAAERLREELLGRIARAEEPVLAGSPSTIDADGSAAGIAYASAMAGAMAGARAGAAGGAGERPTVIAAMRPGWVRLAPFTLSGLAAIGVIGTFLSQLLDDLNYDPSDFGPLTSVADRLDALPVWLLATGGIALLVVLVALLSIAGYVINFGNYRLVRQPGPTLQVSRGLIAHRSTAIEESRLRGVEITEPLLLRMAGGARCSAIATGLRDKAGTTGDGSLLLPAAPRTTANEVATAVLTEAAPVTAPMVRHGRIAMRRRYTRTIVPTTALAAGVTIAATLGYLPAWTTACWTLLLLAGALAADRYHNLGHALVPTETGNYLIVCSGSLRKRRSVLACDAIIGWNLRRSFFQRMAGLVTLSATTAAGRGHYDIVDIDQHAAVSLANEATPHLRSWRTVAPTKRDLNSHCYRMP